MSGRRTLIVAVGLAAALAGCGSASTQPGGFTYENTLTVYSALPLQGPQATLMQSIVNGEILALKQAGGRAHGRPISFASLNDAPLTNGTWDGKEPRAAGQDLDAIAYVGDYDSAATAISLPIINANDILQVSPGSPYIGFTDATRFDRPGEPRYFFLSGHDTFARLVRPISSRPQRACASCATRG
jgi:branched-chain amino acid transport system substrate-binding protein